MDVCVGSSGGRRLGSVGLEGRGPIVPAARALISECHRSRRPPVNRLPCKADLGTPRARPTLACTTSRPRTTGPPSRAEGSFLRPLRPTKGPPFAGAGPRSADDGRWDHLKSRESCWYRRLLLLHLPRLSLPSRLSQLSSSSSIVRPLQPVQLPHAIDCALSPTANPSSLLSPTEDGHSPHPQGL